MRKAAYLVEGRNSSTIDGFLIAIVRVNGRKHQIPTKKQLGCDFKPVLSRQSSSKLPRQSQLHTHVLYMYIHTVSTFHCIFYPSHLTAYLQYVTVSMSEQSAQDPVCCV